MKASPWESGERATGINSGAVIIRQPVGVVGGTVPTGITSGAMTVDARQSLGGAQAPVGPLAAPGGVSMRQSGFGSGPSGQPAYRCSREYVYATRRAASVAVPSSAAEHGSRPAAAAQSHGPQSARSRHGRCSRGRQRWRQRCSRGAAGSDAAGGGSDAAGGGSDGARPARHYEPGSSYYSKTACTEATTTCGRYPYPACNKVITRCRVARPLNP